jgi:hypothetical protein
MGKLYICGTKDFYQTGFAIALLVPSFDRYALALDWVRLCLVMRTLTVCARKSPQLIDIFPNSAELLPIENPLRLNLD